MLAITPKQRLTGLDIGHNLIKMVTLSSKGNVISLDKIDVVATPEGAIQNSKITDFRALSTCLKQLFTFFDFRTVSIAVSGTNTYVSNISLGANSNSPESKLLEQLGMALPISTKGSYLDYKPLRISEAANHFQVAAAPKATVNGRIALLQQAGLTPRSVELEINALARCAEFCLYQQNITDLCCWLDVGKQQILAVTLIDGVADYCSVHNTNDETVQAICSAVIPEVIQQHISQQSTAINLIYLSGSVANSEELFSVMQSSVPQPLYRETLFTGFTGCNQFAEKIQKHHSSMAVALGLALRGMDYERH